MEKVAAGKPGEGVPRSVLFICGLNSIRSPMASGITRTLFPFQVYSRSAGIRKGELDPFVNTTMEEIGVDVSSHLPHTIFELNDGDFELTVALSPEAHKHLTEELSHDIANLEYWPMPDPTTETGKREQRLDAYRAVRNMLVERIKERFEWSEKLVETSDT